MIFTIHESVIEEQSNMDEKLKVSNFRIQVKVNAMFLFYNLLHELNLTNKLKKRSTAKLVLNFLPSKDILFSGNALSMV